MTPTNSNPSPEWLQRAYAMGNLQADGWTCHQIAAHYEVGYRTVHNVLYRLRKHDPTVFRRNRPQAPTNLFLRHATAAERNPRRAETDRIWCDRIALGDSLAAIASDYNTTPASVATGASRHRKANNHRLNQLRGVA